MTMNTDNTQFDRLVDDELNEEERRELLGGLDEEPNGWRQCAMAFLEAQCWKQALKHAPSERDVVGVPAATASPRRSPWSNRISLISAMAASFLVAMWLGTLAHQAWIGHPNVSGGSGDFAANKNVGHPTPNPFQAQTNLAGGPRQVTAHRNVETPNPWHLVTVSAPGEGQVRSTVNVPAIERDGVDERWARSMPSAIPDDVLQALARTGHQVQQRRELVPVPLQDGRSMIVPVDNVDVHYVGNGTY
jgi:hypothetical protein